MKCCDKSFGMVMQSVMFSGPSVQPQKERNVGGVSWSPTHRSRPSFATDLPVWEEEEPLERLHDFNLDFDLLELAVDEVCLHALLLFGTRHHHWVGLHIFVRPRAT